LGFSFWLAEHNVRSRAKRERAYHNDNNLGATIAAAADHEASKIEVGLRRIGRMHNRNGVGASLWIVSAQKMPSPG